MSELSFEARALVIDGRSAFRPTTEDRVRVASRLASRLSTAVLLGAHVSQAAPKALSVARWSPLVAALGLVAAGASFSLSRTPDTVAAAPLHVAPLAVASPEPLAAVPDGIDEVAPAPAEASPTPSPRKQARNDELAEEVALMSQAARQLRAGDAAAALVLLDRHRRQFPAGRLLEERFAARAQALCALGEREAARAELSLLTRSAPRSPHVGRAERACGLAR